MGLHDIYHNFSNCKIFVIIIKKDIILTILQIRKRNRNNTFLYFLLKLIIFEVLIFIEKNFMKITQKYLLT